MSYRDGPPTQIPWQLQRAVELLIGWLPVAIVVGLWELASGRVVGRTVLPPPSDVFVVVWELFASGSILPHLGVSLLRVVIGLALSIVIGVLLGIGMARSQPVEDVFEVFLALLYPIPKVALVPLAILWLGVGTETAVLIIFLACLLPIILNSYNAATNVDQNLIWSAQMMGTSDRELLLNVVFPDTVPEIITGIKQAIPIAFIALIGAELIASNQGVGNIILQSGQVGNYTRMFAAIVVISAAAYVAVRGFEKLHRRVVTWV